MLSIFEKLISMKFTFPPPKKTIFSITCGVTCKYIYKRCLLQHTIPKIAKSIKIHLIHLPTKERYEMTVAVPILVIYTNVIAHYKILFICQRYQLIWQNYFEFPLILNTHACLKKSLRTDLYITPTYIDTLEGRKCELYNTKIEDVKHIPTCEKIPPRKSSSHVA